MVRQRVRPGRRSGLQLVDQTKIVTAASELARNTLIYGGRRHSYARNRSERACGKACVLPSKIKGPGIPDLELAMRDGFTTGSGLGLGLGARNGSRTNSKSTAAG